MFGYLSTTDLSTVGIYGPQDTRVSFLRDFGLEDAPAVPSAVKPGEFYGTVSAEKAADLGSDVFLTCIEDPATWTTFTKNPLLGKIPAFADGHVYAEADKRGRRGGHQPDPAVDPGHHREVPAQARRGRPGLVTPA